MLALVLGGACLPEMHHLPPTCDEDLHTGKFAGLYVMPREKAIDPR